MRNPPPEPQPWTRRLAVHAAVLSSYLLIALIHLRPLASRLTDTIPRAERMDVLLHGWIINWTARQLLRAPWDLFDANLFFPHPKALAYTEHMVPEALPVAPVWLLTRDPIVTYNIAYLLTFVLGGWGTFLLVRRLTGNPWAAWVAGAFACYFPAKRWSLAHINTISVHGVPFAMLALHRLLESPTPVRAMVAGVAVALSSLVSAYYTVYFPLVLAVGVPSIWWAGGFPLDRRRVLALLGGAVAAAIIALPILFPYLQTYSGGTEPARAYELQIAGGMDVAELFVMESLLWSRFLLPDDLEPLTSPFFPGVVAVVLALAALWAGRLAAPAADGKRRSLPMAWAYAAMFAASLIIALGPRLKFFGMEGPALPYHLIYNYMPGASALRAPYRAAILGQAFLAVLIGFGAAWLLSRERLRKTHRLAPAAAAIVLVVLMVGETVGEALPLDPLPQPAGEAYAWLAAQPGDFGIMELPTPGEVDRTARGQWLSTMHWKRRVTGHNGRLPDDVHEIHDLAAWPPRPRFLNRLRDEFPVRYVIVHLNRLEAEPRRRFLEELLPGQERWWEIEQQFGDTLVLRMRNGGPARNFERRFAGWMVDGTVHIELADPIPGAGWRMGARIGEVGVTPADGEALAAGARSIRIPVPAQARSTRPVRMRLDILGPNGQTVLIDRISFATTNGLIYP